MIPRAHAPGRWDPTLMMGLVALALLSGCASVARAPLAAAPRDTVTGGFSASPSVPTPASPPPAEPPAAPSTLPSATSSPTSPLATPSASPAPMLSARPVHPLAARITPDVFVRVAKPLTKARLSSLVAATGATTVVTVDVGSVGLGAGQTLALGVDPGVFRVVTPSGTAESNPLWQSVADGSVAVAHTVARALGVVLGGTTNITPQTTHLAAGAPATGAPGLPFRVGALATTGMPGVGLIVDNRYDTELGLARATGVVLAAPGRDPVVTAALAKQTLGSGTTATPLRVPVSDTGRLTWVAPAVGPITAGFGYRESPLVPGQREFHGGIDIGAPLGAPIYAASAGTVVYAGPATGFGNEVVLQHAGGVQTVYGHMERILVAAGAPVAAGQPIALVGSEGESTGPHLHFEVHVGGNYTDPLAWLIAHGVQVQR